MAEFLNAIEPMYKDPERINALLSDLPRTKVMLNSIKETLDSPEVKKLLGKTALVCLFACNKNILFQNNNELK